MDNLERPQQKSLPSVQIHYFVYYVFQSFDFMKSFEEWRLYFHAKQKKNKFFLSQILKPIWYFAILISTNFLCL